MIQEYLGRDIGANFVKYIKPKSVEVTVLFNTRGGIAIDATWRSNN